jgi:purine-binding chemotaxis protein CheW
MATNRTTAKPAKQQNSGQFSTFYIEDLFFGVDVLHVQEVLRFQPMTPVPQAPEVVEGLINLRGQIVTAIDMRRRLHMPQLAAGRTPMNIVVRTPDGAVSLLVDEIGDVLEIEAANYERPPDNLDPAAKELISGVYKMKNSLLLVLDTEKAVEVNGSLTSLNSKLDTKASEAAANGRRTSPTASSAAADDQAEPTQSQSTAGKATKRVASKKNESAVRAAKTGHV